MCRGMPSSASTFSHTSRPEGSFPPEETEAASPALHGFRCWLLLPSRTTCGSLSPDSFRAWQMLLTVAVGTEIAPQDVRRRAG